MRQFQKMIFSWINHEILLNFMKEIFVINVAIILIDLF